MRLARGLLTSCILVACEGCYRYVPTTIEAVSEGARVRAVLTPEAQQRLRDRHQLDAERFEGTLLARNGDELSFFVPSGPMVTAFGAQQVFYQQVEVRRGDVMRTDVRRMDKFRTASLVAVGAGAAAVVIVQSTSGGRPGSRPPPGGEPPESVRGWLVVFPLLRW